MLMLSKKINQPCQALFIDWRVLENYNLFKYGRMHFYFDSRYGDTCYEASVIIDSTGISIDDEGKNLKYDIAYFQSITYNNTFSIYS